MFKSNEGVPSKLVRDPDHRSANEQVGNINDLLEKYGSKLVFLKEEDLNLGINELMSKYEISKTTAWKMIGRGYIIKGYHEKNYQPDPEWCNQNVERIERAARIAYIVLSKKYPDVFPYLDSAQAVMPGIHPEDLIGEAILEIIGKAGTSNLIATSDRVSGEVATRDIDDYLIGIAKNTIMDRAKLSSWISRHREESHETRSIKEKE